MLRQTPDGTMTSPPARAGYDSFEWLRAKSDLLSKLAKELAEAYPGFGTTNNIEAAISDLESAADSLWREANAVDEGER